MSLTAYLWGFLLLGVAHAQFKFSGPPAPPSGGNGALINVPGGYLPPVPLNPVCMPTTNYVTSTSTSATVVTSYTQGPGGRDSTTTVVSTRVVPTTVYETDVATRLSTATQRVTSTRVQSVSSTYVTTIGGLQVTRTVASTVVVPTNIVSTAFTTVRSSKFVTITSTKRDVTTVVRPVTVTRTEKNVVTSTVPVRGQDVTRSTTVTSKDLSTVQTQPPAKTITQSRTIATTIATTTNIQGPPRTVTQTKTTTVIQRVTETSTIRRDVTKTQQVTSTVTSTLTVGGTKSRVVTSTKQVKQTSQYIQTSTRLTTQYSRTTVFGDNLVTNTRTPAPVVRTSTAERVVTQTRPGVVNVITTTDYTTRVVQRTSTITGGGRTETITVTSTVKDKCGATGYNYNKPKIPFNF